MRLRAFDIAVIGLAAAALNACASVKVSLPSVSGDKPAQTSSQTVREHAELRAAADRLDASVPSQANAPRASGLKAVVFGGRGDADEAAAKLYLASLPRDGLAEAVLEDADVILSAGRDVAAAGILTRADAPSDLDVAILEGAIGDVQRARRLVTTALKHLRDEGAPLTKAEIRELGDAFVETARDIGTAADLAAARTGNGAPTYAAQPLGAGQGF